MKLRMTIFFTFLNILSTQSQTKYNAFVYEFVSSNGNYQNTEVLKQLDNEISSVLQDYFVILANDNDLTLNFKGHPYEASNNTDVIISCILTVNKENKPQSISLTFLLVYNNIIFDKKIIQSESTKIEEVKKIEINQPAVQCEKAIKTINEFELKTRIREINDELKKKSQ